MSELFWIYIIVTCIIQMEIAIFAYCEDIINNIIPPSIIAIHNATDMNWFGCIIVTILYWIICPLFAICYYFYWLFHIHIGRDNDREDKNDHII